VGLGFTMPGGVPRRIIKICRKNIREHNALSHKAWLQHPGIATLNPFKVLPILMEKTNK
jgi:hypothetical protein